MPKKKKVYTYNPWGNLQRAYEIAVAGGFKIVPLSPEPLFGDFKSFVLDVFNTNVFATDGELTIELVKIEATYGTEIEISFDNNTETLNNGKLSDLPVDFESETHILLVNKAREMGKLNQQAIENVYKIAAVIAAINKHKLIKLEHVAEAIHYQIKPEGTFYNLMDSEYVTIEGVEIPVAYLNPANKYTLNCLIEKLSSYL